MAYISEIRRCFPSAGIAGDLEVRDRICQDNEVLGTAYRMKESLCSVYSPDDACSAKEHPESRMGWVGMSGLYRFRRLADTVEKHPAHILRWFSSRVSNALMEGTNSMISVIRSGARGSGTRRT
ncbi:MAG: transposase [Candidatus Methanoplasma sp.]|jgi:transposase|nr:transposase [Candidatus Methanoplasma sp.]